MTELTGEMDQRNKEDPSTFLPRIVYEGSPAETVRAYPEFPYTLDVDPYALRNLLKGRGLSDGFISKLTIRVHNRALLHSKVMESALGGVLFGFVTPLKPYEVNINARSFGRAYRNLVQGSSDQIYDKRPTLPQRIRDFVQREAFEYMSGASTAGHPGYFAGNVERRSKYLELARTGKIPRERAFKFMERQARVILQNRWLQQVFEHELEHIKNPREMVAKFVLLTGSVIVALKLALNVSEQVANSFFRVALEHGVPLKLATIMNFIIENYPIALTPPNIDRLKGILFERPADAATATHQYREWAEVVHIRSQQPNPNWALNFSWDERDFQWAEKPEWIDEELKKTDS